MSLVDGSPQRSAEFQTYVVPDFLLLQRLSASTKRYYLTGYESYMVEQWVCHRRKNSCIISFTGNSEDRVVVGRLSLPTDQTKWPQAVHDYFADIIDLNLKVKHTEHGILFVASLNAFPTSINLIKVPSGEMDADTWWKFKVNENLKRTGCSGRAILSMEKISDAAESKFRQIFKPHESVAIDVAVDELAVIIQLTLYYFGLLDPHLIDGLLCDRTFAAISNWWYQFGSAKYSHLAKGGIPLNSAGFLLTPVTVAALLAYVISMRNALAIHASNRTPKDPFDVFALRDSIIHFQKHQHLHKSGFFDEQTVEKLWEIIGNKGSSVNASELIGIVKSTMKEVSGRGTKDTLRGTTVSHEPDLENLKACYPPGRCQYLFLGKGRGRRVSMSSKNASSLEYSACGIPFSSLVLSEDNPRDIRRAVKRRTDEFKIGVTKLRNNQRGASNGTSEGVKSFYEDEDSAGDWRSHRAVTDNDEHKNFSSSGSVITGESINGVMNNDNRSEELACKESERQQIMKNVAVEPYNVDHACGRSRARSFSDLRSVSLNSCSDEGDDAEECRRVLRYMKKRSLSFSVVEDALLPWTPEFEVPEEKIERLFNQAVHSQQRLAKESMKLDELKATVAASCRYMQQNVSDSKRLYDKIEYQIQGVSGSEYILERQLLDAEALSERLKYESGVLERKVRDVEDALDSFSSKLSMLEKRFLSLCSQGWGFRIFG